MPRENCLRHRGGIAYGDPAIAYGVLGIVYGNLLFGSVKRGNLMGNFHGC